MWFRLVTFVWVASSSIFDQVKMVVEEPVSNVPACLHWLFGPHEEHWQFLLVALLVTLLGVLYLVYKFVALLRAPPKDHRTVEKVIYNQTAVGDYVPERMHPGSVFVPGHLPPFQMWVERLEGGTWKKVGGAFRTELGIFTAKHVPAGADFRLSTQTSVVDVPYDQVRELDADAILIPSNFAPSGVVQAKLARAALLGENSMQVEISNGVQRSVGPVVASKSFGSLIYSGSTVGGFSGSPYYSGRTVLGMHTGAAAVNYGYEAGYLAILAVKKEDSQDVILDWMRKG